MQEIVFSTNALVLKAAKATLADSGLIDAILE
jgi:hypothetical protein